MPEPCNRFCKAAAAAAAATAAEAAAAAAWPRLALERMSVIMKPEDRLLAVAGDLSDEGLLGEESLPGEEVSFCWSTSVVMAL